MVLQVLLTLYGCVALISLVLMLVLHFFHDRTGYYKTAVFIWTGLLFGFLMDGALAEKATGLHHIFGIAFLHFTVFNIAILADDIYKLHLPRKHLLQFSIGTWILAVFMHFVLRVGFEAEAFVLCAGMVTPGLLASYRIAKMWKKTNIVDRLFLSFIVTDCLHILDYPFLRNMEGTAVFGFSFGIFLVYFASILIPVLINQKLAENMNHSLEQKVQDRSEKLIKVEEQLFNSTKMAALGQMAGGIAHEINTPLAVIKTVTGQIAEVLEEEQAPDRKMLREMAKTAETTVDRIAKIVTGLRQFSRDGSKDGFQEVSAQHLIESTVTLCQERLKNNSISLIIETMNKDIFFEGREVEVSQVLLNLLNNAHDAIADEKEKWIRIAVVDLDQWIEFHITDSGHGIPADQQKKIFQPFYTTKEVGQGTGMGLSISLGIIQNHNGEIRIDSNCPHTRFIVCLPKAQSKKAVA